MLRSFQIAVPTVSGPKSAMEELVAFLTGDFETHEAEALSRDNRLSTFAAVQDGSEFHGLPPECCLFFLVGQFISQSLQILVGFL
jgi:hypothetical protein